MAISLIPQELSREKRQEAGLPIVQWIKSHALVAGGSLLFAGVLVAYGALLLYGNALTERVVATESTRTSLLAETDRARQIIASNFALRAEELQRILGRHSTPSDLLQFFEDTTHPDVVVSSFAFSFGTSEARISGRTQGYPTLAEQILIWEENPAVRSVTISDFNTSTTGLLSFKATLQLTDEAYDKP